MGAGEPSDESDGHEGEWHTVRVIDALKVHLPRIRRTLGDAVGYLNEALAVRSELMNPQFPGYCLNGKGFSGTVEKPCMDASIKEKYLNDTNHKVISHDQSVKYYTKRIKVIEREIEDAEIGLELYREEGRVRPALMDPFTKGLAHVVSVADTKLYWRLLRMTKEQRKDVIDAEELQSIYVDAMHTVINEGRISVRNPDNLSVEQLVRKLIIDFTTLQMLQENPDEKADMGETVEADGHFWLKIGDGGFVKHSRHRVDFTRKSAEQILIATSELPWRKFWADNPAGLLPRLNLGPVPKEMIVVKKV